MEAIVKESFPAEWEQFGDDFLPDVAGLIIADRYDAALSREASDLKLAPDLGDAF